MSDAVNVTKLQRVSDPLNKNEFERTYYEVVPVRNGVAFCKTQSAVDMLLKTRDYVPFVESEPDASSETPVRTRAKKSAAKSKTPKRTKPKSKPKKKKTDGMKRTR